MRTTRTLVTYLAAAVLAVAPVALIAAPAHATTPCYMNGGSFSAAEFDNWYNGARWGDSLSHVEDVYAGCAGLWETGIPQGDWNGRATQIREWPRADGGTTEVTFAHFATAPTWRAHDTGRTVSGNYQSVRVACEWPRPDNDPCNPVP